MPTAAPAMLESSSDVNAFVAVVPRAYTGLSKLPCVGNVLQSVVLVRVVTGQYRKPTGQLAGADCVDHVRSMVVNAAHVLHVGSKLGDCPEPPHWGSSIRYVMHADP